MNDKYYDLGTVLNHSFNFIFKRPISFCILLFTQVLFLIGFYKLIAVRAIEIIENFDTGYISRSDFFIELFTGKIILYILLLLIAESFIFAYTINLFIDYTYENNISILKRIKSSLKNFWYVIVTNFLFVIVVVLLSIPFFIVMLIPIIGILALVGYFAFLIYIVGYYRFVYITAFIERSVSESPRSAKELMTGHFVGSILIVIIFGIMSEIIEYFTKNALSYHIKNAITTISFNLVLLIILLIGISFLAVIIDTSYIILGYKDYDYKITSEKGLVLLQKPLIQKEYNQDQLFHD